MADFRIQTFQLENKNPDRKVPLTQSNRSVCNLSLFDKVAVQICLIVCLFLSVAFPTNRHLFFFVGSAS